METWTAPLEEIHAYRSAREAIERDRLPLHISGCVESQKCHMVYGLGQERQWRLIIAANEIRAREILEDYRIFDRDVLYYPAKDVIFYSADIRGNALSIERLKVIRALLAGEGGTVVTTIDAGMESTLAMAIYRDAVHTLAESDLVDLEALSGQLVNMGYQRQAQVEAPGDYSVRGGIIDIFPVTEDSPYRLELWGDEIDTIRSFDVESQRSIERVDSLQIFPASELILTKEEIQQGFQRMRQDEKKVLDQLKKEKKFDAANRLHDMLSEVMETYEQYDGRMGLEAFLPYFSVETGSLFDYFPENSLYFADEPARCMEKAQAVETEFREGMESRLENGYILPGQMNVLYSAETVTAMLQQKPLVLLSMLDVLPKLFTARQQMGLQVQPTGSYNKQFELLIEDLKRWKKNGYRVLVLSASRTRAKRLSQDFNDYEIPVFYREVPDEVLEPGQIMVSYGYLRRGFIYNNIKFCVVTESDIFGARQKRKRRRQKQYDGKVIQSFHELNVGDYVVHENHGLGIYRGIEKIQVDNVTKDYIKIEYGDGGNLYVPASGLDVLQKYASQEAAKAPRLNKLNSREWNKTKTRVRGAVRDIARELVELYAKRQQQKGHSFGPDTVWQKEFEELFPFEETQDQLDAVEATKRDMESNRIMDRLICGDVGYGKTEIALRAAFKAVNDGKQVAFLVPTTILAQQHYNTLLERLGDFPVRVEMLSRFRTPAQQKQALALLRKGQVDIVIGTHRLLSKDVAFKNLGLLIVDEEQRFGVTHKEKIKQMKGNVDVLTLSATPIPRTLHMSLVGIRDMSVLEEPPVDRIPIQTFVMEHNPEIIREAVNRELARGGQVYYVYNRVQRIEEITAEIAEMVPDANVAYAHGQMSERQLENIMMSFISGEIDVLVATTIIETGLDISNVNTIIIDHADRMGLSQLYQLRGRVGRSNRTAYAFLMYQRGKMLREVAEKRLAAIREYTELGSGIRVAMRDLEIRGAGNLLGAAQSGHMEAVGYDLYCKMLNEAVRKMKGEDTEEQDYETLVDIQIDAYIPSTYIRSEFQKLDMYKRIAGIENTDEYMDMQEELEDRFGNIPAATDNLLRVALLKAEAHRAGITQISQKPKGLQIHLYSGENIASEKARKMIELYQGKLKYMAPDGEEPFFLYQQTTVQTAKKKQAAGELLQTISELIREIGGLYEEK